MLNTVENSHGEINFITKGRNVKVYTIKTLNKIAERGLNVFNNESFKIDDNHEKPDAIILRSFNMHDMEIDNNIKAIARAGAGVNNIPVNDLTERVSLSLIHPVLMLMR